MAGEETIVSGMAGRYAIALFELARDERSLDAVKADLDRFEALIDESADLERLVRSPVFTAKEQGGALAAVLDKAEIGGLAANFLKAVTANRRLFAVRDILTGFPQAGRAPQGRGERRGHGRRAARRQAQRGDHGGAQVDHRRQGGRSQVKVDPAIIGGLVVKLGSRMVDTSLRTKLNAIKQAMKEVG